MDLAPCFSSTQLLCQGKGGPGGRGVRDGGGGGGSGGGTTRGSGSITCTGCESTDIASVES